MAQVQPKEQLGLDTVQEQGFLSFLQNLKEKTSTTVRLFDRGEYFTLYGEDALLAAKELFQTISIIKYLGSDSNKVPSVVLSKLNFESFVRDLLLLKQYRVEVYKQKSSAKNDWEVAYKASPGNLVQFEDILFGSGSELNVNAGVLSLKLSVDSGKKLVGAAHIDVNEQALLVCQFIDDDVFTNLEALIVQLGARECIISPGDMGPENVKLKQVLSRNQLLVTERKRADFSANDAVQDISKLVKGQEDAGPAIAASPEMALTNAVAALVAGIKYLELLSNESNCNQFTLKIYELSGYLHLDSAALKALHVEPSGESRRIVGKERNLLSLLDKCCTAQGKRLLSQWLRQPLMDINKIVERQDLVEALVQCVEIRHALTEDHLKRVPDLSRLARKMSRKIATLQDCYKLYQCVLQLPYICEALARYDGPHVTPITSVFTTPLQESIEDMSKFQEMIETTLDMTKAAQGEFVIKPEFDDALAELREKMDEFEAEIQKQLKRAASDLGLEAGKSIKLETNSQLGFFLRVTLKDEKVLRNNRSYRMIDSNKAGVRFRSPILQDLNDQHLSARQEYEAQQKSVADEIIAISAGYVEVIQNLNSNLGTLDCIVALAKVASSAPVPYCRPKLLPKGTGTIELTACRHPCLELQDDISYIPNDCKLSKETGTFHIITGPNMGGKSTFLRSVGTAVLMAQIGSFVACEKATISVVDSILARVGAGDCQMKGVSTFMTEMLETATILKTSSKDSLIVIDELGRGTSTYDGFGLAWAISECIAKEIGAFCLFATHFHELTALSEEVDAVKNYHVSAATIGGTLTLLYQVKSGPCDRSFGIQVAELANFPPEVVQFAKRKARELEDDILEDDLDASPETLKKRKEDRKMLLEKTMQIIRRETETENPEMEGVPSPDRREKSSIVTASVSSQTTEAPSESSEPCNPWPYLDKYFKYLGPKDEQNLKYKCLLCLPNKNFLSTSNKSQNNLKRHVSRRHPYAQRQFVQSVKEGVRRQKLIKQRSDHQDKLDDKGRRLLVSPTISEAMDGLSRVTQVLFEDKLMAFFTDNMFHLNGVGSNSSKDTNTQSHDKEVVSPSEGKERSSIVTASISSQANGLPSQSSELCNPWPYLDKYFEYLGPKDEQNLKYKCLLCLPNKKMLSTSNKSQNNLKRHIFRRHPCFQNQFKQCIKEGVKLQRKMKRRTDLEKYLDDSDKRQWDLVHPTTLEVMAGPSKVSETFFKEKLITYPDTLPLDIIDSDSCYAPRSESEGSEMEVDSALEGKEKPSMVTGSFLNQVTAAPGKTSCNPWPYLDKYFEYLGPKDKQNLKYKCLLCISNKCFLSTSNKSQNNLKRHVFRRHPSIHNQFRQSVKEGVKLQKIMKRSAPQQCLNDDRQKNIVQSTISEAIAESSIDTQTLFEEKEEEAIIEEYLAKVAAIDADALSNEELQAEFQAMKKELETKENPYIRKMLMSH